MEGSWRREIGPNILLNLEALGRPSTQSAMAIRNKFAEYFMSAQGSVPWQNNVA